MSSGCAVICTNVGGMTNIVINKHNGIIINPSAQELYQSIKELIKNKDLRTRLAINAHKTIEDSFSSKRWKNEWIKVIKELNDEQK